MRGTQKLAAAIERAISGPMWHGPALGELLAGIEAKGARARPVARSHSIWELVLHLAVWARVADERLAGRSFEPTAEEDWPALPPPTTTAWQESVAQLYGTYRHLAQSVGSLTDEAIANRVPGHDYTIESMLRGVIEHGVYHGGQIAILKRGPGLPGNSLLRSTL